ncbi:type II toxin-antitoxin system Phd/YefM family antitoxin, partial [Klebsiella michiganensis]|uniref:type II toxin-antitoxin system Phd/YefM family antitoxin n=1 Tax=Klebsiella michiganensis TaxID=1134687 RepID=UPI0025A2AD74
TRSEPMRMVGAFEAKTKFSELLDLVEAGEEIQITRHGKPVAALVPSRGKPSREEAVRQALRTMDEVRGRAKGFGGIKELIEEGRRY